MHALITGFPGFISAHLIDVLRQQAAADDLALEIICLALPAQADAARSLARRIMDLPGSGAIRVVEGDITHSGLGLSPGDRRQLTGPIDVYHLAAIYDLRVGWRAAHEVNVGGTRRVLDLASRLEGLRRLVYFSSCYVAGRRRGVIREDELLPGRFRNPYEATKHAAEIEVRRWIGQLPITVVRPAIVTGVWSSGATSKYDGPYMVIERLAALERLGQLALARWLPSVGRGSGRLHTVPVDHVARAAAALARSPAAEGRTVHLAPSRPPTTDRLIAAIRAAFGLPAPRWRLPLRPAKRLLAVPGVAELLGLPHQLLDYFDQDQHFDDSVARELLPEPVPDPLQGVPAMVAFLREYAAPPSPFAG